MLKIYLVTLCLYLLYGLIVAVDTNAKEEVYYKHTPSTAAVDTKSDSKDVIPIVMEGQPPSSEPVKLNNAKVNKHKEMKKGSKIVPKKGVLDKSTEKVDQNDNHTINFPLEKPVVEKTESTIFGLEPKKQVPTNTSIISIDTEKTSKLHTAPVKEETEKQIVSTTKAPRKPKPKPEVTIGGKEADEPIPASPTNKSPTGMPRKIDYIVPVVITITALPLLGVAFYVLYKRGRDYWDKRHYRRMDFLIDGMYNE